MTNLNHELGPQTNPDAFDYQSQMQSEYYRITKYLKAISALAIFHYIFLIMWIIGVVQWSVAFNLQTNNSMFILFVVSLLLYCLSWLISSVIALFSVLRHFKKHRDLYPRWVFILSQIMVAWPCLIGIILYFWIAKNSSELLKYN